MRACARFDEVLITGYFLNGLLILDVQFANLATYMDGITDDPFYFGFSKGDLANGLLDLVSTGT